MRPLIRQCTIRQEMLEVLRRLGYTKDDEYPTEYDLIIRLVELLRTKGVL